MPKFIILNPRRSALLGLLALLLISCSVAKLPSTGTRETIPLSKEAFILNPFGYVPSKQNMAANLPRAFKLQAYTFKNKTKPETKDTIFRFYLGKSELFLFKIGSQEYLTAGRIYDNRIILANGLKTGISRDDFFKCFTNLLPTLNDTIRIMAKQHTNNSFSFVFKKHKLIVIKFDNKIDNQGN